MLHFRKGEKLKKKNGKKIETGNDMIMYFDIYFILIFILNIFDINKLLSFIVTWFT